MDQHELRSWAETLLDNPTFDMGRIVNRRKQDISNILSNLSKIQECFPELMKDFQHLEVFRISSQDYDNYDDGGAKIEIYCANDKTARQLLDSEVIKQTINFVYDNRPHRVVARTINGQTVSEWDKNRKKANQLIDACKTYLEQHPGCRKFEIIGPEEDRNLEP